MKKLLLPLITSLFLLTNAIDIPSNTANPISEQTFGYVKTQNNDLPDLPGTH